MNGTKLVFAHAQCVTLKVAATGVLERVRMFDYDEFTSLCKRYDAGELLPIEDASGCRLTLDRQLWLNLVHQTGVALYVREGAPFLQAMRQAALDEETLAVLPQTSEKTSAE